VAEGGEVAVRATMTVTHVGTFMGIEPTGKRVSVRVMGFFRLEEGKMAGMWSMQDVEAVAAQLEG
jgi:predicted ester cyclase